MLRQFADELASLVTDYKAKTMIGLKSLRSFTGKVSHLAGVVVRLRWCCSISHAVLAAGERESAANHATGDHYKANLVAVKRFQLPLEWLSALWGCCDLGSVRAIHLKRPPSLFMIIPDGCPWGIGSVLCDAATGIPIEAMADELSPEDALNLNVVKGSCSCQAVSEALAVLVSVRVWKSKLRDRPLTLQLRDDSSAALALSAKLASSSPALNFLGAELALLLEETLVENIAGPPQLVYFVGALA